jgi:hypothetical protein
VFTNWQLYFKVVIELQTDNNVYCLPRVRVCVCIYIYIYVNCQIRCIRRKGSQLPEDGRDSRLKHVAAKTTNTNCSIVGNTNVYVTEAMYV